MLVQKRQRGREERKGKGPQGKEGEGRAVRQIDWPDIKWSDNFLRLLPFLSSFGKRRRKGPLGKRRKEKRKGLRGKKEVEKAKEFSPPATKGRRGEGGSFFCFSQPAREVSGEGRKREKKQMVQKKQNFDGEGEGTSWL